jgi:tRNA (guanine-N7-)-methyltransferase
MRLRKKPWIEEAMKEVQGEYVFLHDIDKFKGHWQEMFPGKRLCLEIGCGKGRFTIGMAELYPDKAFIGIETHILPALPSLLLQSMVFFLSAYSDLT